MHRRIHTALKALRQDLADRLDDHAIHDLCNRLGHKWRTCQLVPAVTIRWLLIQALFGNTALTHIARLANKTFSDSALCQARARLPLALFRDLLRHLIEGLEPETHADDGLWLGHRTLLVDGSSFSMPDVPALQARFGQPGGQAKGCGFPVAKIMALFHARTGMLMEIVNAPLRTHDMAQVSGIHAALRPGDVLVGDRGFCSFSHLTLLVKQGCHAVFRVHQKQIVDFTPGRPMAARSDKSKSSGRPHSRWLRSLGAWDQVVEWIKPRARPSWMSVEEFEALPTVLEVRELRYEVGRPGFRTRHITLVTTLLDATIYPLEKLAELYGVRWRVELDLRDLKQTMKMDVLKCKSVDGVLKELHAYAIAYNLVRLTMLEAGRRQGVPCERISFVDALRWVRDGNLEGGLPELKVNPDRTGRYEPRVRKRRPKQFQLMKRPRQDLKQAMLNTALTN